LGDIYRQNGIEFSSTGTDLSDNNPYRRPELVDPPLTFIGREQARALQPVRRLPSHPHHTHPRASTPPLTPLTNVPLVYLA
jgi:hypothetical protein